MSLKSVLVANRGEIAIRVMRAAAELGLGTVAVYSEDDVQALHTCKADEARALGGHGAAAYLDGEQIIAIAREANCDAVHPGYGFLSENAGFAERCAAAGLAFVGPRPETLALFGDKARARALAESRGVPLLDGISGPTSLDEAGEFLAALGPDGAIMIKAVAGGGGRGMRQVREAGELEAAYRRCRSEAAKAFGNDAVYVERFLARARHVEVQVVGDGKAISQLGERECSIQRRHQKLAEVAPAPNLEAARRAEIAAAAVALAESVDFLNLGTFEFLLSDDRFAFIEANPRLQVEHTVTEAVTGLDLVKLQFQIAAGRSLAELGLEQAQVPEPKGFAIELRINAEQLAPDGTPRPASGTLTAFEPPSGPGLRTDTAGHLGHSINANFDSLLAKLIAHSPSPHFADVVAKAYRGLCEFRIEGVANNLGFLQNLLRHPEFQAAGGHTGFVEEHLEALVDRSAEHQRLYFKPAAPAPLAGARIDQNDPLAVLDHGKSQGPAAPGQVPAAAPVPAPAVSGPENTVPVIAPMQGTIVSLEVDENGPVQAGQALLVMESMKMEHVIEAEMSGQVRQFAVAAGDTVYEGHPLAFIEPGEVEAAALAESAEIDLETIRPDLAEVLERHEVTLDPARPASVERRRKTGQRTARENVEDLCDEGSFMEYGALVIAAQRQRRSVDDLIANTPADGLITGLGQVNGQHFGDAEARCVVMSYDYTVLAGTQGFKNHYKKDRMFELAADLGLPLVFFTEGGGGRPGDTDWPSPAGLDCLAFNLFGKLSGQVPLVGINSGRCFAGNAALLGCCDVVIATQNSSIGMGGPAMIEGGGLGVFRPEEVGPMDVQVANGVVDIPVADEAEAVATAKQYLSYFQGALADWECADQRRLRHVIPENRLRIYDVRQVIELLADTGSVLKLRRHFGHGMVTALIRIEGRPLGLIANNPTHLAGAIDSDGADKAARFMQLCDAFDIPLLTLCDTPGMMVGPEVEKTALVRHCCRLFVTGANLSVPLFTMVLRKGYGLGAQAMAGGSFRAPAFTVAWPTGEFGGMGLEGAVKLGFRKELAAIENAAERQALFEKMVAQAYQDGKALNFASHFEIDDVIDPMESRRWIVNGLKSAPPAESARGTKKRPAIDTW
ncbi:MAG: carboxyl transferase domain-containing protein [Alphaproteobacteria bacterium]|nr:carboxyl transferase domain-containing protein [Alphaproteobacteria bacterium]